MSKRVIIDLPDGFDSIMSFQNIGKNKKGGINLATQAIDLNEHVIYNVDATAKTVKNTGIVHLRITPDGKLEDVGCNQ